MIDKVVVSYIGDSCSDTLELSLASIIKIAKQVIFVWGMEDPKVSEIVKQFNQTTGIPVRFIQAKWDPNDKIQNGKQRNIYLQELQRDFFSDWVLVLDPDEVLENPDKLIEVINKTESKIISPKMRHLLWNFSREDSTQKTHHVPNRLFKVDYRYFYPELEHTVLSIFGVDNIKYEENDEVVIWHLGYCKNMFDIRKKFIGHMNKSNIHSPDFLVRWFESHIFETYPNERVSYEDLPEILRKYFFLDQLGIDDMNYFLNRTDMELKHTFFAMDFINHFHPKTVWDLGTGAGQLTYLFNRLGIDCIGIDKSQYIINLDKQTYGDFFRCQDIKEIDLEKRDLVICIDILEHLDYKDIDDVLRRIKKAGEHFIFSVPIKGTPEADGDKTHRIKEDRSWWKSKLKESGFTLEETPKHWIAREQFLIG